MKAIAGMMVLMLGAAGAVYGQAAGADPQTTSAAQSTPQRGDSLLAGPGITFQNGLYEGADSDVLPGPFIFLEQGQFFIKGRTAGYRVFQDDLLAFDVIGQWRLDGYDQDDSDFLDGMDDREMTIDGGAAVTVFDGWGQTTISYAGDLLSKHSGQELAVTYSKTFSLEKWSLTPAAGVRGFSSSLGDYYYGVQPDEAIAGRPAYDIGETWNPFAGLSVMYSFNEQWSALTSVRYTQLDHEIKDSPIVEDSYDLLVMAGVLYKF